jgi:hypothetical protein
MKSLKLVAVVGAGLAVALAGSGCEKKGDASKKTTTGAINDAAKGAAGAVADAAARAKEEAVAAAQELYESTSTEFDALAAKVSSSTSPEKPVWQGLVDGVKAQLGEAKTKLESMRDENADWKKLSTEFSALMTKIGDGIKSLASQVK